MISAKLDELVDAGGFDSLDDLLLAVISDSVSPGICTNPGCHYTTEVEPDQNQGYCEICGTQTVKSALVLAGVI
jgi:hypothetical protein